MGKVVTAVGRSTLLLLSGGTALVLSCEAGPQPPREEVARVASALTVTELPLAAASHPTLTYVSAVVRYEELWHKYSLVVPDDLRLRLIQDALEFLDDSGVPQFRLNVPTHEYNDTYRSDGFLEVEDCLVDRNPAPPWGRSFSHPITTCSVYVYWDGSDPGPASRDAFLDTGWELPSCLSDPRAEHALVELQNGRLLVVGGWSEHGSEASTEVYDPTTATWAATGSMKAKRHDPTAVLLDDGKVVVIGGASAPATQDGELYDPATGAWTDVTPVPEGHYNFGVAALPGARALVAGGRQPMPYPNGSPIDALVSRVLDLSAGPPGVWSTAADTPGPVWWPYSLSLPDGRVVMIGGGSQGVTGASNFHVYDPDLDEWESAASLQPRIHHTLTLLPDQRVAAVAGSSSSSQQVVHFYDPDDMTVSSAPPLSLYRQDHTTSLLPSGVLIVVGGVSDQGAVRGDLTSIEQLVLGQPSWTSPAALPEARRDLASAVLSDRSVLVVGGHRYEDREGFSYEVFPRSCVRLELDDGDPGCFSSDDCSGEPCVDGVCCDSPCSGACEACSSYKKGYGANGVCEPIAAGRDPEWECGIDDVSTCGSTGACDGSGSCETYADATVCQSPSCIGTTWTLESKCSGGSCVPDGVIECSNGFACVAGACATFCSDATACAPNHTCDAGSCKPIDGAGGAPGAGGAAGAGSADNGGAAGAGSGNDGGAAGAGSGNTGGTTAAGGSPHEAGAGGASAGDAGGAGGDGGANPGEGAAGSGAAAAGAAGSSVSGGSGGAAGASELEGGRAAVAGSVGVGGDTSHGGALGAGGEVVGSGGDGSHSGDDGGCGCRVKARSNRSAPVFALAFALFGVAFRRRGRQRLAAR